MIVLDTHTWVWWVSGQKFLSRRARRIVEAAANESAIYVAAIGVWEVAQLVARGRLELTMNVESWVAKSEAFPFLHFVPVDNAIAIKSVSLPEPLHSDPADRIIIATALLMGFPLITRDKKITNYPHVRTVR